MNTMIVTVCNAPYAGLLQLWLTAIRRLTELPVTVICLDGFSPTPTLPCATVAARENGNPFPKDLPDHACFEKLRVFEHVPDADCILFIDVDVLVLRPFWNYEPRFEIARSRLILAPDLFVGYKERMEQEFRPYDRDFRMRRTDDGGYFYFNTGVYFASREAHATPFRAFVETWKDYVATTGQCPSIFDQNLVNYCLIRYDLPVHAMPVTDNCLRQYESQSISAGHVLLNGEAVTAYHFNGGDGAKKLERWTAMQHALEKSLGDA